MIDRTDTVGAGRMTRLLRAPDTIALLAAGVYLLLGVVWIALSDREAAAIATSTQDLARLQLIKGWFYVAITSVIAYMMVRALASDIRRRREAESFLRLSAVAFETRQPILVTDREGTIVRINQAYSALSGYTPRELLGRNPRIMASGQQSAAFYQRMWDSLLEQGYWEGELVNKRRDGALFPQWQAITAVSDDKGRVTHFVAQVMDLSDRHAINDTLHRLEYFDALTGLPNRKRLLQRIAAETTAIAPLPVVLMLVDIWRFSEINKALGPERGDEVLCDVARRLLDMVQDDELRVARVASDVFAMLLPAPADVQAAEATADPYGISVWSTQLRKRLDGIETLAGSGLVAQVNIGVSVCTPDMPLVSPSTFLGQAEAALDQAKSEGGGALRMFDPSMQARAEARAEQAAALREALVARRIVPALQPKCRPDGTIIGAEALARWNGPDGRAVPPMEFIPLAESLGLDVELGELMVEQVLALVSRFEKAGHPLPLAVNVSSHHLMSPGFASGMLQRAQHAGVHPGQLVIEVTESQLVEDFHGAVAVLQVLRESGFRIAIDDFGTGYSSLSYLKALPVDELKIDGAFVRGAEHDTRDRALLQAIVTMGHSLGLDVVAEGIETQAQADILQGAGCESMQGWLFGRPIAPAALLERLCAGDFATAKSL